MKPALFAFLAAASWGLWWIPIRYLQSLGMDGALGGITMNAGAFAASIVWALFRRHPVRLEHRALLGAVLVGMAVATFSAALNLGDVIRIILLFYLAPAWSKIIEWAFLGMPWRWTSTLALVAALSGAFLILGGDPTGGAVQVGDVLSLLSGVAWSAGAALIFTSGRTSAVSMTVATSLSAVVIGLSFLWLGNVAGALPDVLPAVGLGMGIGIVYVLPMLAVTLWTAQQLSPATLSFLLTAEILSGVASGAVFLDEPFGLFQVAGAALIIIGALSEVLPKVRTPRGAAP